MCLVPFPHVAHPIHEIKRIQKSTSLKKIIKRIDAALNQNKSLFSWNRLIGGNWRLSSAQAIEGFNAKFCQFFYDKILFNYQKNYL